MIEQAGMFSLLCAMWYRALSSTCFLFLFLFCFSPANMFHKVGFLFVMDPESKVHWAQRWPHPGPTGLRWAPCWPVILCYLGRVNKRAFYLCLLFCHSTKYYPYCNIVDFLHIEVFVLKWHCCGLLWIARRGWYCNYRHDVTMIRCHCFTVSPRLWE